MPVRPSAVMRACRLVARRRPSAVLRAASSVVPSSSVAVASPPPAHRGYSLAASAPRSRSAVPVHPHKIRVRSLFIQTADTPNPESVKFVPGRPVFVPEVADADPEDSDAEEAEVDETSGFFVSSDDPTFRSDMALSPLAARIFGSTEGIRAVYLGRDFVTVTKYMQEDWQDLQPSIFGAIMDHYDSGDRAVTDAPRVTDTTILDDDDEVVAMIKELLETRIRPAVQDDGGDIRYVGFDEHSGIVTVRLAGSCVGCPSSSVTLKNGVENMLMHYIPEVTAVHAEETAEGDAAEAGGVVVEKEKAAKPREKTYEERLAAAGIPFSE
mmetsp:Transcript_5651/g.11863  ORF Transcript_5651/g.11863 Transcript_5651/m.11863 type:complete len:325 (-) Transcript_5651:40-1014(-)